MPSAAKVKGIRYLVLQRGLATRRCIYLVLARDLCQFLGKVFYVLYLRPGLSSFLYE